MEQVTDGGVLQPPPPARRRVAMEALAAAAAARMTPLSENAQEEELGEFEFVLPRDAPPSGYLDEDAVQRASLQHHLPEVRYEERQQGRVAYSGSWRCAGWETLHKGEGRGVFVSVRGREGTSGGAVGRERHQRDVERKSLFGLVVLSDTCLQKVGEM